MLGVPWDADLLVVCELLALGRPYEKKVTSHTFFARPPHYSRYSTAQSPQPRSVFGALLDEPF